MKTIYQILATGIYKYAEGRGKFHSKKVYHFHPSKEEIDNFVYRCTNSEHPINLFDLDISTVTTKILELELDDIDSKYTKDVDFVKKTSDIESIINKQLERFHVKYNDVESFTNIVEKINTKYDSDSYYYRYMNRGCEPPYELYWFLFKYASKYGREASDLEYTKYGNDFTTVIYYVCGYFFNRMDGQGSVIEVMKKL